MVVTHDMATGNLSTSWPIRKPLAYRSVLDNLAIQLEADSIHARKLGLELRHRPKPNLCSLWIKHHDRGLAVGLIGTDTRLSHGLASFLLDVVESVNGLDLVEAAFDSGGLVIDVEEGETLAGVGFCRDWCLRRVHPSHLTKGGRVEDLYIKADALVALPDIGMIDIWNYTLLDQTASCDAKLSVFCVWLYAGFAATQIEYEKDCGILSRCLAGKHSAKMHIRKPYTGDLVIVDGIPYSCYQRWCCSRGCRYSLILEALCLIDETLGNNWNAFFDFHFLFQLFNGRGGWQIV